MFLWNLPACHVECVKYCCCYAYFYSSGQYFSLHDILLPKSASISPIVSQPKSTSVQETTALTQVSTCRVGTWKSFTAGVNRYWTLSGVAISLAESFNFWSLIEICPSSPRNQTCTQQRMKLNKCLIRAIFAVYSCSFGRVLVHSVCLNRKDEHFTSGRFWWGKYASTNKWIANEQIKLVAICGRDEISSFSPDSARGLDGFMSFCSLYLLAFILRGCSGVAVEMVLNFMFIIYLAFFFSFDNWATRRLVHS